MIAKIPKTWKNFLLGGLWWNETFLEKMHVLKNWILWAGAHVNKDNIDFIELSIKSVSWNSVEKPLLDFAFLSKVPTKKRATFERNMDQMPFFCVKWILDIYALFSN